MMNGYICALKSKSSIGEIVNIGNGIEYSVRRVVEMIYDLARSKATPAIGALSHRPGETMHFYCDNSKAENFFKWKSRIGLDEGLCRTITWYRENIHRFQAE